MTPPSFKSNLEIASEVRPRLGKSAGFENEQTRSVHEKVGQLKSTSASNLASARIVDDGLVAFKAQMRAASLSIHSKTFLF